jgi:hypothetical protein
MFWQTKKNVEVALHANLTTRASKQGCGGDQNLKPIFIAFGFFLIFYEALKNFQQGI